MGKAQSRAIGRRPKLGRRATASGDRNGVADTFYGAKAIGVREAAMTTTAGHSSTYSSVIVLAVAAQLSPPLLFQLMRFWLRKCY